MMIRSTRVIPIAAACFLAACATTSDREAAPIAVKVPKVSREYSSFNARVASDAATVEHSFVASLDPNVETVTRLQSSYTQQIDAEESLRVGDAVSSSGMWGRSVRYGGMQFGSGLGAREDVIVSERLATSGLAVLPTVADALFASVGDPSERLAQQNLSVARSLRGDMTAKDAMGHSVSVDAPMIAPTRLAEPGCADFSVGVGKVRRDYAIESNEYGPMFANTTVVCGAPLGLTVEGHGEYLADEVAALGVGLARRVGPLGTASVAFASSRTDVGSGWLARMAFEHSNELFEVALRSRLQSREFREVGTLLLADPIMKRDLASLGVNVTEGSTVSLAYATQMTWARERTNVIALKQSLSVGRGSLSMSAGHSLADNFGSTWYVAYNRPFGGARSKRSLIEEFDPIVLQAPATVE